MNAFRVEKDAGTVLLVYSSLRMEVLGNLPLAQVVPFYPMKFGLIYW